MIRTKVRKIIEKIAGQKVDLEHPVNIKFGDYSTNIALKAKISPEKIIKKLKNNKYFEKVEKAGPGFINIFLNKNILYKELENILDKKEKYSNLKIGKNKKIQVEFISANPTGPLTIGNARGGPFGDTLANVLAKAGYQTEKEYYINNCGAQILALGNSVLKNKDAKYKGEYINILNKKNKLINPEKTGEWASEQILKNYIQKTIKKLNINFDSFFKESELYKKNLINKIIKYLDNKKLIYKKDNAIWFKSKKFGDKRDRVLIKSDKTKTYLASDIAYHFYKFKERKFNKAVNVWGADHHGDIPGLQAGLEAIGYKNKLKIILMQFVTLGSKRMSKRGGNYVYMDELIDEVGKDAVRFFFLQKSPDTHLNFDIDLAKKQSKNNPVFYVQYAHARICSVLKKGGVILNGGKDLAGAKRPARFAESECSLHGSVESCDLPRDSSGFALRMTKLTHPSELNLIKHLAKFPEIIEDISKDYQVQRLPYYALELANKFHKFYEDCKILDNQARISLIKATKIILKNTLDLMGVDAPEKM